jgi:hypothetical protein
MPGDLGWIFVGFLLGIVVTRYWMAPSFCPRCLYQKQWVDSFKKTPEQKKESRRFYWMRRRDSFPWFSGLDEARRGVLVNTAFNMGIGGVLGFPKFLVAVSRQEWDVAAAEMLDSAWAHQVGDRAQRLAQQMKSGDWV